MEWIHSVRTRMVIGFAMVLAPLVFFLFYNNNYAMNVVRDQVTHNYDGLLKQYVQNTDQSLEETSLYLYRFMNDPDFATLYTFGVDSNDYYLTKIRISNRISSGIGYYHIISSIFIYSDTYKDLLMASAENYNEDYKEIWAKLPELRQTDNGNWQMIRTSTGEQVIVRMASISNDLVAGVWIRLDNLVNPLRQWNLGDGGSADLVDQQGRSLTTPSAPDEEGGPHVAMVSAPLPSEMSKRSDLYVEAASSSLPVRYRVFIPEKTVIQNLPYFQRTLFVIPFAVVLILIIYFVFLQRVLIGPMSALIRGMRRIGQGKFETRLNMVSYGEFAFLSEVFNDMAEQIHNLTVNVYEEKLRVQQAEYKHLQVQINPHFYMNSLNIIYNLAVLKDTRMVQKMALHLADYFRFTIHMNRTKVTLAEELKHISNYMEIQALRYPDNLSYRIDLPDELRDIPLPPLTIQPFVENAVLHGFCNRSKLFHVSIAVQQLDEDGMGPIVQIVVRDDGIGFSEEWLGEFAETDWRTMQGDHIGIWNVMRRLDIEYGEKAALELRNWEEGAEVTIRLPIPPAEEGKELTEDPLKKLLQPHS